MKIPPSARPKAMNPELSAQLGPAPLGASSARVVVLETMKLHLSKLAIFATVLGSLAMGGCSKTSNAATADEPAPRAEPQAAKGANYETAFALEGSCEKSTTCIALVTVEAKGGYQINDKYPYRFKLDEPPADGVSYPKPTVGRDDATFSETTAVLRVPFVAENAGEVKVGGTLSFSVCSDDKCLIDKQALAAAFKVD